MTSTAIVSVILGLFIVLIRGLPWVFAPVRTMEVFRKLTASAGAIRSMGVLGAALGLAMVLSAWGAASAAEKFILYLGGFILVLTLLFPVAFPGAAAAFSGVIADALEDDTPRLRGFGLIAVGIGVFFLYLGLCVL